MKYDQLLSVCQDFLYQHPMGKEALAYLDQRLSRETQKRFGFGFFPAKPDLRSFSDFLSESELEETQLFYTDKQEQLGSSLHHHNLLMPYKDVSGKVIALVGRSLLPEEDRNFQGIPKYKNTAFKKSRHLFGLSEGKKDILRQGLAYIVEGQFDCIKAQGKGIQNVVALGSANMSFEQLSLLLRYTNRFRLLLDNDEAGKTGKDRITEKYGKYVAIESFCIPEGFKDLDELLSEIEVPEKFEGMIRKES